MKITICFIIIHILCKCAKIKKHFFILVIIIMINLPFYEQLLL